MAWDCDNPAYVGKKSYIFEKINNYWIYSDCNINIVVSKKNIIILTSNHVIKNPNIQFWQKLYCLTASVIEDILAKLYTI